MDEPQNVTKFLNPRYQKNAKSLKKNFKSFFEYIFLKTFLKSFF